MEAFIQFITTIFASIYFELGYIIIPIAIFIIIAHCNPIQSQGQATMATSVKRH